jgi:Fe-S cluster assembly protein SufD
MKNRIKNNESRIKNKTDNLLYLDNFNKFIEINIGENEKKNILLCIIDEKDHECGVNINIKGKNSDVNIFGIIIGSAKQIITLKTSQKHLMGNSKSNLFITALLFDNSKLSFNGLIRVERDAQNTDAFMKNRNIMMSDDCSAVSKPYLEILANNVKCSHASTTGNIGGEQLFYLETRGIKKIDCIKLLVQGYFKEILDKIQDKKATEKIMMKIETKLIKQNYIKYNV